MAKNRNRSQMHNTLNKSIPRPNPISRPERSPLDIMRDGAEYESLIAAKGFEFNFADELRQSLKEIEAVRGNPAICYISNMVNSNLKVPVGIDETDDLPFSEMVNSVPNDVSSIDIILVTPGGSTEQVAKFVDKLRPRFEKVSFIIPYQAMSAGTIFSLSGNDILMGKESYIGPIDPQVKNKDGNFIPAQGLLTAINDIRDRGNDNIRNKKNVDWTDLQLLKNIDTKEIGNVLNYSAYSVELAENFLCSYKFKDWSIHSSRGEVVTYEEKKKRANEIATLLCNHDVWKTHRRGITRDIAWNECKLKIIHFEGIEGLERAIRRFWALTYYIFTLSLVYKCFISENYCIFRQQNKPNNENGRN